MDNLLKTAIVGTAQVAGNIELTTGTQVDMLSRQLPSGERERNILLTAGSLEIYRLAGQRTQKRADQLEQAQPEQLPLCSEQAALLLETLLVWQYQPLLPEALERLQASQRRVPYRLLPRLLQYGSKHKAPRAALLTVMGERGPWLAQQNPEWKWAIRYRADENESTENSLPDGIEEAVQKLQQNTDQLEQRHQLLASMPTHAHWSLQFSLDYITFEKKLAEMGLTPVHNAEWTKAIMLARTALHPDSLDYALAPWSFPEKDPVQDRIVWLEYLQTVVKGRTEWKDFYRACHEVL
jgi:hypothetical protein